MDGNGRWAKRQGKIRAFGHKAGAKSVRRAVSFAANNGIDALTLYAFSTENWDRPKDEVTGLMEYLQSPEALRNARRARERRIASRPERRTLNREPRTTNGEPRTPNGEPRTTNGEPRTTNTEQRTEPEHEPSTENPEA